MLSFRLHCHVGAGKEGCSPGPATQKLLWILPALQDVSLQVTPSLLSPAAVAYTCRMCILHTMA